jgi:hypothetical protein
MVDRDVGTVDRDVGTVGREVGTVAQHMAVGIPKVRSSLRLGYDADCLPSEQVSVVAPPLVAAAAAVAETSVHP